MKYDNDFYGRDFNRRKRNSTQKLPIHDFVIEKLKRSNIKFESKFNNSYIIVTGLKGNIDFYPGTGAFSCKSTGARGKGIESLIKYAKSGSISF